jgi:hypothetical protein
VKDTKASILSAPAGGRVLQPTPNSTVEDPSATNRIRGDCVGDKLTLYVNDQKLAEATDNELASGEVGLSVGPNGSRTDVLFDNFSVSKP